MRGQTRRGMRRNVDSKEARGCVCVHGDALPLWRRVVLIRKEGLDTHTPRLRWGNVSRHLPILASRRVPHAPFRRPSPRPPRCARVTQTEEAVQLVHIRRRDVEQVDVLLRQVGQVGGFVLPHFKLCEQVGSVYGHVVRFRAARLTVVLPSSSTRRRRAWRESAKTARIIVLSFVLNRQRRQPHHRPPHRRLDRRRLGRRAGGGSSRGDDRGCKGGSGRACGTKGGGGGEGDWIGTGVGSGRRGGSWEWWPG